MNTNKETLYNHVDFLTSIQPPRNFQHIDSLAKVVWYIENEFKKTGGEMSEQMWTVGRNEYKNLILSYNPNASKRLVVGAHYDVYGEYPGADDNASAVAGLLESARLVFEMRPDIDYRIDFVAYCLEEPPFFGTPDMGSYVHAKALKDKDAEVIGMICYEMIGYFSDEPGSQEYPDEMLAAIYPSTANFIVVVGIEAFHEFNTKVHELMKPGAQIDVQTISFPNDNELAGLSDHHNYWRFGFPALMINDTSFIRNPNYHEPTDTIDTLDFDKMAAVVDATVRAIVGM